MGTFALVEGEAKAEEKETMIHQSGRIIENGPLHLTIEKNGTITMEDRKNKRKLNNLHIFEDIGDIGNEYIFKQPFCDQPILSSNKENSEVKVLVDTPEIAKISILQEMEIPVSADERLEKNSRWLWNFVIEKQNDPKKNESFK